MTRPPVKSNDIADGSGIRPLRKTGDVPKAISGAALAGFTAPPPVTTENTEDCHQALAAPEA